MTTDRAPEMARLVVLAVLLALPCLVMVPAVARGVVPEADWRALLDHAARAARMTPFTGEAIWITWIDGQARVATSTVRNSAGGELVLRPEEGPTVRIGYDGAGLVDREDGWLLAVPANDPDDGGRVFAALEAKYKVTVASPDHIMDRPCTRLEIARRSDSSLRERLWIDRETGLLLRRETYDGGQKPVRLAAYLSLDLGPPLSSNGDEGFGGSSVALAKLRRQQVSEVGPAGLRALRDAGWTLPEELPGGYEPLGVYVLSSGDGQPLQVTYSDGLYTVSMFQQAGSVDWDSLPRGAERVEGLGWPAYHWPGAVPAMLVWEAGGRTFSLVGDPPDDEFRAIARALPRPEPPSLGQRLGRGLRRLWSFLSPWN